MEFDLITTYFNLLQPKFAHFKVSNRSIVIVRTQEVSQNDLLAQKMNPDDSLHLLVLITGHKYIDPIEVMQDFLTIKELELSEKPVLFWLSLSPNTKYDQGMRPIIRCTYPSCNQANFSYIQRNISKYLNFRHLNWETDGYKMSYLSNNLPSKIEEPIIRLSDIDSSGSSKKMDKHLLNEKFDNLDINK